MKYCGVTKGRTIELAETLPFPEGQNVRVTVEPWPSTLRPGSPQAIVLAMREPPHLRPPDVDELEAALESAKLPMHEGVILNLDENDLWIAACAREASATLVTRDSDLRQIDGLTVEDWTQ